MTQTIELSGHSLTLEDVERVAGATRPPVHFPDHARTRVAAARAVVDRALESGRVMYGINTGFGALSEVVIPLDRIRELQENLIRSHACGVGNPLPQAETRAIMLLRANVLALGHSGVREQVIELLVDMLNAGVHPIIPERGSVGASGDLAPLSHLALVLIGEGEAELNGERMGGGAALARAGLAPVRLMAKEGLALNNGTQVHTGIGVLALLAAERAVETAELAGCMSLEGLRGTPDAFDAAIQRVRPHPGQLRSAATLRALLAGSEIRESHRHGDPRVQDAYSLRCMPQVHGAARHAFAYARGVLETEVNSATDNPLIFPEDGRIISGGNFHGQPIAQALDVVALACADLAAISERRIARLIDPTLSGLPPFLTADAGVSSGFMMAQITAAALVADARLKAMPASTDTVPTDNNKEDHVSMGVGAALKLREVVQLLETVLALEMMTAAQAIDFLRPLRAGAAVERAHELVRRRVPRLERDRVLAPDVAIIADLVRAGEFARIVADAAADALA